MPARPVKDLHCDDYAAANGGNQAARWFIFINRLPVGLRTLAARYITEPTLFADYEGQRVRVTMASRLGDLGIHHDLNTTAGYTTRVPVTALTNFSETP